jgi:S-adenosylmethionine/arginine decarboxylase-like enzyme
MHKSAGMHLFVDGLVRDDCRFTPSRLTDFFYKAMESCKFKVKLAPNIQEMPEQAKVSAVCLTTMGHIVLHAWAKDHYFTFDAYCSEDFDWEGLVSLLDKELTVHTSHVELNQRIKPKLR